MLQKMRSGDIDFVITSTANASTLAPQAGVFSLHFIFRDKEHLAKTLADPAVSKAFRDMIKESVQGAQVLGLLTMGMRNIYTKKEIKTVDDLKGMKIRVQATKTEDTHFPAYGTQTVHMPFGEVYTSLQTGVVNAAENGINVYLANKHYEVAPILSITEHEANNNCIWVSDKTWNSLSDQEKEWVQAAADEVAKKEPAMALKLEADSAEQAEDDGRQGRRRRRQVRLHEGRGADPGPARQGAGTACGQDPRARPQREIATAREIEAAAPAAPPPVVLRRMRGSRHRFCSNSRWSLQRHRHLKWKALDPLEDDVDDPVRRVHRRVHPVGLLRRGDARDRSPVAVAATGDHRLLRLGRVHRHGGGDAPHRPLYLVEITKAHERRRSAPSWKSSTGWSSWWSAWRWSCSAIKNACTTWAASARRR